MKMNVLVICNAYPSETALYRNGFIHRRVKAYLEAGIGVQVFYNHQPISKPYTYSFDGIEIRVGNHLELERYVSVHDHDAYLVHFAEPTRIEPLKAAGVKKPVIVWVHGFEAEAWFRRWFNFIESPEAIREALVKKRNYYDPQNDFFRDLMTTDDMDISFVNVSDWFRKNVVEPDMRAEFKDSVTIPNIIDEKLFPRRLKQPEQRLKILSIRPYASMKYGNDQTVAAILELSTRPYFDQLSFTLCGQGRYFEATTQPVRHLKNVILRKEFLTQPEIAKLHEDHGVFLCPTRFDSQGVSMCEAVSSGLVAVSSNVAAIPEFIHDRETGLLADPESPLNLADLIEELYFDEEMFLVLSEAGSSWMHENCGSAATIGREIDLIRNRVGAK